MGQQQLLLLVLGIVIVGLAVVVGINAFSENRVKSNADATVTDALRIASDVQAWALKPSQFGGKADGANINTVTFAAIGYPTSSGGTYSNVNADYDLSGSKNAGCTGTIVMPTGAGTDGPVFVHGTNTDTQNHICIQITGTNSNSIGTTITFGG